MTRVLCTLPALLLLAACFAPVLATVLLLLYRQIGREAGAESHSSPAPAGEFEGT